MQNPVRKRSFEKAAHQPFKGSVLGYGRVSREEPSSGPPARRVQF